MFWSKKKTKIFRGKWLKGKKRERFKVVRINSGSEKCKCGRTVGSIYVNHGRFSKRELDFFIGRCKCGEIYLRIDGDWNTNIIEKTWKEGNTTYITFVSAGDK